MGRGLGADQALRRSGVPGQVCSHLGSSRLALRVPACFWLCPEAGGGLCSEASGGHICHLQDGRGEFPRCWAGSQTVCWHVLPAMSAPTGVPGHGGREPGPCVGPVFHGGMWLPFLLRACDGLAAQVAQVSSKMSPRPGLLPEALPAPPTVPAAHSPSPLCSGLAGSAHSHVLRALQPLARGHPVPCPSSLARLPCPPGLMSGVTPAQCPHTPPSPLLITVAPLCASK